MISELFINRPRLAAVVSIFVTLAGTIALFNIPVAQYPEITPPVISVSASYPGASAQDLVDTVAAPIEKEVNGVENMLYMSSTCSNSGSYSLSVTFDVGTDPDIDQVNLQNRIQLATSKLPQAVVDQGLTVRRRSSEIMAAVSFVSPKKSREMLFLSNYVSDNVKDTLTRIKGVSDVYIFGEQEYSMRIWIDPQRLTALKMTTDDVIVITSYSIHYTKLYDLAAKLPMSQKIITETRSSAAYFKKLNPAESIAATIIPERIRLLDEYPPAVPPDRYSTTANVITAPAKAHNPTLNPWK